MANGTSVRPVPRLARSLGFNLVGMALPALFAVLAVPRLAAALGTERLGVLTLVWTITGYLGLLHFGVGRALTQSAAGGRRDDAPVEPVVWTGLVLVAALGVVGGGLLALASRPLAFHFLEVPPALRGEAATAFRVLALALPFVVTTPVLTGVLESRMRFDAISAVAVPVAGVTYFGPLLVLRAADGLVWVVAVIAAGRVAGWLAYLVLCLREVPSLRRHFAPGRAHLGPLLRFGGWTTVSSVVSPVMVYLDRFAVGGLLSATAVAYYATPQEVLLRAGAISGALAGVLFPAFSAARHEGEEHRLLALLERGVTGVFVLVLPLSVLLAAFAAEGLHAWMGAEFAARGARVVAWLAFGLLVNGLAKVAAALVQGIGRPDLAARLHLAEVVPYLLCLWLLVTWWGIEGAAIAWVLRATADAAALFIVVCSRLPEARGVALRSLGIAGVGALAVGGAAMAPGVGARAALVAVALLGAAWGGRRRRTLPPPR